MPKEQVAVSEAEPDVEAEIVALHSGRLFAGRKQRQRSSETFFFGSTFTMTADFDDFILLMSPCNMLRTAYRNLNRKLP